MKKNHADLYVILPIKIQTEIKLQAISKQRTEIIN
jgi:hypothetical protein